MAKNIIQISFYVCFIILMISEELLAQSESNLIESDNTAQELIQIIENQKNQDAKFLVQIGSIISPSGSEHERATAVADEMRTIGLSDVIVDDNPNAIGILPGQTDSVIVFVSTLDDLAQVAEHQKSFGAPYVEGGRVIGPGTNTSLTSASLISAANALIQIEFKPYYTLVFAAVAQEETGLTGMKSLHEKYSQSAKAFIDILGDGDSISYGSIGIHWWRILANGPGGHTLRGGTPNVNQGMGRAIDRILLLNYPENYADLRTHINISMVRSGDVFNHKPDNGWFSLDLRSLEASIIADMEESVREILQRVEIETGISFSMEPESLIPGGQIPGHRESRLVQVSKMIATYLGADAQLSNAGSSNMNVAIHAGTPAIGLGGNRGGERGQPEEWASIPVLTNTAKHVALLAYLLNKNPG